jgi:hypothetical protein
MSSDPHIWTPYKDSTPPVSDSSSFKGGILAQRVRAYQSSPLVSRRSILEILSQCTFDPKPKEERIGDCLCQTLTVTHASRAFTVRFLWKENQRILENSDPYSSPLPEGINGEMLVVEERSLEDARLKLAFYLSRQ